PTQAGIYKFIDPKGVILYVGKAKNLKNRLSSYFGERKDRQIKTKVLVRLAHHIEFTIVGSEQDALLLECALIKEHQPRYNVMLKDGKTYPYICIKMERFPKVFVTRRVVKDGSTYFGPYTSGYRVQQLMELIKQLFQLRTCQLNLQQDLIDKGKFKVCLEYHIKNCAAPCVGFEKELDYNEKIAQIKNILRGHFGSVRQHLKREMSAFAEALQFEKAQGLKEKLTAFEDYQGKSTIVSTSITDVDVFSIATDDKMAYVNYLKVVNGAIIHTYTLELTKNMDEDEDSMLAFAMPYLRDKFLSENKEILLPFEMKFSDPSVSIVVPKIGDKKKLVELSEQNAKFYLLQKQKQEALKAQKQTSAERILKTLQSDLQMENVPFHIECFDNSNLQGTNPVSACVVFKNAKPSKKDYRHYNVKTVEGPNDFATMEEVVYRRYKRLLSEGESLPQLVIIDGGKGQLSSAMKSLKALGIDKQMVVVGIAKQLEEIFFPDDPIPLYIDKKSESLKLIQQARNEAHRFGITFHRNQRSKNFIQTELTGIEGIGEVTAEKLLTHFGSVKRIREAKTEELEAIIGKKATKQVVKHLIKSAEKIDDKEDGEVSNFTIFKNTDNQ
ncbi:MAG: excinuclease ABC subunit C, partial [Saprospiraceae bacterium]|nr:excinuclease ABC subunit C [Saprospiraceae bacterium]